MGSIKEHAEQGTCRENGTIVDSSHDILQRHWLGENKNISDIFPRDAFVDVPWCEVANKYAVLTYSWSTYPWTQIIRALKQKGEFGKKADLVWLDIFCLDQNAPDKMQTIVRAAEI